MTLYPFWVDFFIFWNVILRGRRTVWWGWRVMPVAHCKWRFICEQDQSWESFCLAGAVFVTFHGRRNTWWWRCHFSCQAQCHFSWRAQYVVMLECHFSWQAQHLVMWECLWKFGVDSRGAKCCNFHYKMRLQSAKSNLGERAGAR